MLRRFTLTRTLRTLLSAATLAVCLIPLQAQESTARVIEMTGRVSVLNGPYEQALNKNDVIRPLQMIVTGPDGFARFQVASDGSTFEVFPNSRVVYRFTPGSWQQLLNVVLGRIKVFISHKPGGNPNEVSSPTAVISVRGTVFDVEVKDDDTTVVSVDEGLVAVRNLTAPGDWVNVHPGETITVIPNVPLVARKVDGSGFIQAAYRIARDAMYQIMLGRRNGGGAIPGAGGGTAQGDRGKGGTTTTPGSPGGTPGSPTGTPGAPTSAPGSGGGQ